MASLTARVVIPVAAWATTLCLMACSSPAAEGHVKAADTNKPLVIGQPAGYNADDITFANNMITHHQQGIDMSALVPDRSVNPGVIAFAAKNAAANRSDVEVARVLLVQWNENPDAKTGDGTHNAAMQGMADQATIAKLDLLHGSEFDTLWLQSMIRRHEGAIGMASAEIAYGTNLDAIALAKHVMETQRVEISQMKQML